jgi:hypothetical protein
MRLGVIMALVLAALTMDASVAPRAHAQAATFHNYSVAYETTSRPYTGTQTRRGDGVYAHSASDVYQPLWLSMNAAGTEWLEVGTGHPASGPRYWYFFVRQGGVNRWIGRRYFTTTGLRTVRIERVAGSTRWRASIEGQRFFLDHDWGSFATGVWLSTGLESYDAAAVARAITNSPMHYEVSETNVWYRWDGQDSEDIDARMCGRWVSDYQWRYGENTVC